jgi:hypothetical protein
VAALLPSQPKEDPVKLTDTQLVILSAASQREDRGVELPPNLKGGAAQKVASKLLDEGLLELNVQQATDLQGPGSMQASVAPRKVSPISVFVSRKSSKLFVRQGFTPLFDVPVRIQDPERSLGTHVFTVMVSE